jgi:uncharacterized membrane protein
VNLELLARRLGDGAARVHVTVVPGAFVTPGEVVAEVWDVDEESGCEAVRSAVAIADERDPAFDVAFGVRQLADVALRALSPSLNDPTTARTCIGYLRAILEALAARDLAERTRLFEQTGTVVVAERREFEDYLRPLAEIARFAAPSREVFTELEETCERIARRAEVMGAGDRAAAARGLAGDIRTEAAGGA